MNLHGTMERREKAYSRAEEKKMIANPVPKNPMIPVNPMTEQNCPCTRNCPRHGNCFECVANHRDVVTSTPPACLRRDQTEKKTEYKTNPEAF